MSVRPRSIIRENPKSEAELIIERKFIDQYRSEMKELISDSSNHDVTFEFNDGTVTAHKGILTARVPFFRLVHHVTLT